MPQQLAELTRQLRRQPRLRIFERGLRVSIMRADGMIRSRLASIRHAVF
jgi:lipopolysaccharide biosynthesis regulator YciM